MDHFEITRGDNCIFLRDKRRLEEDIQSGQEVVTHFTPAQAKEVGEQLISVATND